MVYTKFTPDKPNIADNGATVIDNTRQNLMALRDAIVSGALVDWWMTPSGGTAAEPTQIIYEKTRTGNREAVRLTITWGTSGGAEGSPTTIVYAYASDWNGTSTTLGWNTIGTATMTYDNTAGPTFGALTDLQWS